MFFGNCPQRLRTFTGHLSKVAKAQKFAPPSIEGTVFSRTAWTVSISFFVCYIHRWKNAHFISQAYH